MLAMRLTWDGGLEPNAGGWTTDVWPQSIA